MALAKSDVPSLRYTPARAWGSTVNSPSGCNSSLIGFASCNPLLNVEPKRYERVNGIIGLLEAIFCCSCGATLFVNALATLSITIILAILGILQTWHTFHLNLDPWEHYSSVWDLCNNIIALFGNTFIIVAWWCHWERALIATCPIMTFLIIAYILAIVLGIMDYGLYGKYFIFLDALSAWFWGICIYYVRQILKEWKYEKLQDTARASGRTAQSIIV